MPGLHIDGKDTAVNSEWVKRSTYILAPLILSAKAHYLIR